MINVAILSFWHVHAGDYAKQVEEHNDTVIAAIWDEIPERGRQEAANRGVPFYENLADLLADETIDAVVVVTPTNMHRDVMVAAANAGKHIFTEKVVATTLHEANEILEAVREKCVKLTVSLPRLNDGYTLAIQDIIEQDLLGDLTLVRIRLSHNGATANWLPEHFFNRELCGGGALIDLGCHPMYLSCLFLGMPESISATYGYVTGKEVEDNAVAVLNYENGAIAVVEAGFVNARSPFSIEINGTKGTLLYGAPETDRLYVSSETCADDGWQMVELHDKRQSAFDQWIEHIQTGSEAEENIGIALALTQLMEAANLSVAEQRVVRVDELSE
ncbi:MAG: Gfo/Idh/MocA family oxidoreductase [Gorillibacterium sp.]|nr:Gfo/Idh/MocA family oxidoreductase [Gorillibacterium sp.]